MPDESCEIPAPPHRHPHPIRHFFHKTGPAGLIAILATAMPLVGAGLLAAVAHKLVPWLRSNEPQSLILYLIAFSVLAGFALVPTYANSILGGYAFKFAVGYPIALLGMGGAAAISYLVAHYIVGHRVSSVIEEHPRWKIIRDALIGGKTSKVIGVITLLRLSPLLPFETTNVLFASCEVKLIPYLIGTIIGVAPRTAALVFIASRASKLEMDSPQQRWIFAAGLAGTIIAVIVLGVTSKHALNRACATSEKT